jgi:putative SOS response-associated peptidase YedK
LIIDFLCPEFPTGFQIFYSAFGVAVALGKEIVCLDCFRMIYARAETVAVKPAFRSAFQKGRCLIVSDGFFECLSEHWHRGEQVIDSATIITTEPNELMEGIHDRMPVILSTEDYDLWLAPDFHGQTKLLEMLKPYPAEEMTAYPVSTVVDNPRNERTECIEAAI